LVNESAK
jgi:protein phosphatase 2C family protein 2/3